MPNKQIQSLTVEGVTYDIVDNTSGYIKTFTETDPTVPAWAKAATKPTYTATEVGALPSTTIIPTSTSQLTNDSGYLTVSDIASVMTYKGTKANYAALPSSGNTTGDVWHLTDTGAEWAWDGSAWQELGTAIDLSNYATKATTLSGYGITDAKIQNGTITLGSNTITPLTSYTETDPTVPSWAKQSSKPTYTASEVGALPSSTVIPSKTSDLTNDSGFLTSYTETDPTVPSWAKASSKPSYALSEITSADDIKAIEALTGTSGLLRKTAANTWSLDTNTYLTSYTETDPTVPAWAKASTKPTYTATEVGALPASTTIPSKTSDLTNDSGFITEYTETDPVFSASAAAGITSTDISNWNSKVSDDKTWNGVTFSRTFLSSATFYAPILSESTSTQSNLVRVTATPTANAITKYDGDKYLISTTPSANDNSTKVATTAYVDAAIGGITVPTKVSDLTNDSGFISSYTETDPVFTASAAAGITATDISNWNGKIDTAGTGLSKSGTTLNHSNSVTAQTIQAVYPIKIDAQGHISAYGSAVTIPGVTKITATLSTTWSSKQQTVSVTGVTASNTVIVTPAPASYNMYCECGVYCSEQAANSLTFICDEVPTSSLTVNIVIMS